MIFNLTWQKLAFQQLNLISIIKNMVSATTKVLFNIKALKLKLRVILRRYTVAIVTFNVTNKIHSVAITIICLL